MVELARSQRECAILEKKMNGYMNAQILLEEREKKLSQKEQKERVKEAMAHTIQQ